MKKNNEHDQLVAPIVRGYEDSYLRLTKSRTIFLSEDISDSLAADLSALLLYYDNQDYETPINLYLHSNGGTVSGLLNIYDVMQMVHAPIKTILLGKCYSAGAVILAAGTKGERYALKSANVMIHGVQLVFPLPGADLINSKNYLKDADDVNDMLMKILAKHTGQTLEKVKKDCEREFWFNAKSSLEYGIIDHII